MSRRRCARLVALWAAALVTLAGAGGAAGADTRLRVGDPAPARTLPDRAATPVGLPAAYAGKVCVVHFFATWCPPCLEEIKALHALTQALPAADFQAVSVDVAEEPDVVELFLRPLAAGYPILLDRDRGAARAYGVTGLPTTFVLDRTGRIRYKILGEINREGLRKLVQTVR